MAERKDNNDEEDANSGVAPPQAGSEVSRR